MAVFKPISNIPSLKTFPCATTATISKGVQLIMSSGNATVANDLTYDVVAVAAETVASGNAGTIKVWPLMPGAVFKIANSTANATSVGSAYEVTCATNAATVTTTAGVTTASAFLILSQDGTDITGCFTNSAYVTRL